MNVLIGVHHFPPTYTGGAEQRALRTAAALTARGYRVRVVCVESVQADPHAGITFVDDVYQGIAVRRLSFNAQAVPDPARFEYDNPWVGDQIAQLILEDRPDVFHLISGYIMSGRALLAAQAAGVPRVLSLTDFWFLCKRIQMMRSDGSLSTPPIDPRTCARCVAEELRRFRLPARIAPALANWYWRRETQRTAAMTERGRFLRDVLNTTSAIISPSQFLRGMFIDAGVDASRLLFRRQGRDFGQLHDVAPRTLGPVLRLGVLGQIIHNKGVHVAIEAMQRIKSANVTLDIYGNSKSDPRYTELLMTLRANDTRITLHPPYLANEASSVIKKLDAVIVPSVWYENSPNVILEAFAHRAPVIASALGGMSELVQHDANGLTFATGDAADLACQIQRLLDDGPLLKRLSTAIGPVKTVATEMDELEAIYRDAAGQL